MRASFKWIVALLATFSVSLATLMAPTAQHRSEKRGDDGFLKILLGDGRRLFASQVFTKADVYFHSGYYPSIFDQGNQLDQKAITKSHPDESTHNDTAKDGHAGHKHDEHGNCVSQDHDSEHDECEEFLKEPRDWIERFGRNFTINEHTHLAEGKQREMLPWLRMAAELDPQMVTTYTTAAYWLRKEKPRINEARQFLLDGLRNNPNNDEILFELGSLYYDDMADTNRARNVMKIALSSWFARPSQSKTNNAAISLLNKIAVKLAHIELNAANHDQAIRYFELSKTASPNPEGIQAQIDELRQRSATNSATHVQP